ncbi:hypothetical protein AZC_0836 [Azorhizobium caulinodans ORS 571]|uniref:Uncharacterized protein n=2 Tax=Azorhizobium caulinodans TaxID=7 RepID=A8HTH2_AZOC5|nr:hypothetical protein AZC_0836 [Azorhizobium caulinodans ORS 571]
MAGRKRKITQRQPNGQPKRLPRSERRDAIMGVAMEQPHRRWLPEGARKDQRAESALGRLFLAGLITEPECWAGERLRRVLHEFHIVLATPMTASSAAIMVASPVQQDAEGDLMAAERPETEEERRDRVLASFDRATSVLKRVENSRSAIRDIDALLLRDQVPQDIQPTRRGLAALASMWRLNEPAEEEGDRPIRVRGARIGDACAWSHEEREVAILYK